MLQLFYLNVTKVDLDVGLLSEKEREQWWRRYEEAQAAWHRVEEAGESSERRGRGGVKECGRGG
jgi:hypothetical protein